MLDLIDSSRSESSPAEHFCVIGPWGRSWSSSRYEQLRAALHSLALEHADTPEQFSENWTLDWNLDIEITFSYRQYVQ